MSRRGRSGSGGLLPGEEDVQVDAADRQPEQDGLRDPAVGEPLGGVGDVDAVALGPAVVGARQAVVVLGWDSASASRIEGARARLKRLVERDWLVEEKPGAADVVAAADDVEDDSRVLDGPVGEVAGLTAVGPDPHQPPEMILRRGQQAAGGVPVGRGRRRDQHGQKQSQGVGEQVPLAPVDFLPGVEAP